MSAEDASKGIKDLKQKVVEKAHDVRDAVLDSKPATHAMRHPTFNGYYKNFYLRTNQNINNRRVQAGAALLGGSRALYSLLRMKPIKFATSVLGVLALQIGSRAVFERGNTLSLKDEENFVWFIASPYKLLVDGALGNVKLV